MTLVGEPRLARNVGEGLRSANKRITGRLQAKPSLVFADGAAVDLAEDAAQVGGCTFAIAAT